MFKEITNRDAWSTIRGFVYQVDLTILRWLSLKDNEILELEKGEDIDLINKDIQNKEISRELGQIKYRESKISLNQELALEVLLNFFINKQNNKAHRVFFKFITNTKYTIERPALFIGGKSGIEAWMEIFNAESINLDDDRIKTIQNHLKTKVAVKIISDPAKIKEDQKEAQKNWNAFHDFIADSNNLLQFIKDFEWSVSNDDAISISNSIKDQIARIVENIDTDAAEILYQKLFLFVFKLLTNRGLKKLDSQELKTQLLNTELNRADIELLKYLNDTLNKFGERVNAVESQTNINAVHISKLVDDLNLIRNSDTVFDYRLKNISTSRPILVKNGSQRNKKVSAVKANFEQYKWIGFQGINGTGKSQLASLIAQKFQNIIWLDLRPYHESIEKTTLLIETLFYTISNLQIENNRENWIKKVLESFNSNTIIVLNDIPQIHMDSPLYSLFKLLSENISKSNVRILTTSNFKLPRALLQSFDENIFLHYDDFEFSDEEIIEYILNSGGDETIAQYIGLITIVSHRNPQLLSSIIYHLKAINWGKDSELLLDVILKNEFTSDVLQDAQFAIKKYITDEKSRELLYRLSLINWDLGFKEITAISNVEERIQHPNEKLQDLVNVWIEQQDKSYLVSPLIYKIGEKNLSPDTIKNTHAAIAKSILEDKKINQINASRIISSFLNAKDFNNAGIILFMVYQSAVTSESIKQLIDWGYLNYWTKIDIPNEMSVILRAQIRNEQIRLYKLLEKDPSFLLEKLKGYKDEHNAKISEKVLLSLLTVSHINSVDTAEYWHYLEIILNNFSSLEEPFREIATPELISQLFWVPVPNLSNFDQVKYWLELVEKLENTFQIDFFANEIAQYAIAVLSGRIISFTKDNDLNMSYLDYLSGYFTNRKNEILQSIVIREKIVIEFQTLGKVAEMEKLSIELTDAFDSNIAKYLIYDKIGRLFYNSKQIAKSREWLTKAVEINCTEQVDFIDSLIYAACSHSATNPEKSIDFLKKAADLYKETPTYENNELIYIQILGELGIAYWLNNEFENSYIIFEQVVTRLLSCKEEIFNKEWIRIFSWSGHVLGYISAHVSKDRVPTHLNDGSDYMKPFQGIYAFSTQDVSDLYTSTKDAIVTAHMAVFAEGINEIYKAYTWSLKAFDIARSSGDEETFLMISAVCGHYSTINFKLDEALETSLLFSAVTAHLNGTPLDRRNQLQKINLQHLLAEKPSEKWNIAEETTTTVTIIPLIITVLTNYLKDQTDKEHTFYCFKDLLSNYLKNASDKERWEELLDLITSIFEGKISAAELIQRSNRYGDSENRNFQIICILGFVFYSKNHDFAITQLINVMPYLTKTYKNASSLIRFVVVPFVQLIAKEALTGSFVGSKDEFESVIEKIESIKNSDQNPVQKILQIAVIELDITLENDRKLWLFNYKEI